MKLRVPVVVIAHAEVSVPDDLDLSGLAIGDDGTICVSDMSKISPETAAALCDSVADSDSGAYDTLMQLLATCDKIRDREDPDLPVSWSGFFMLQDLKGYD